MFIGLAIGSLLGSWLALRDSRRNPRCQTIRPSVDHVTELLKHRAPFVVYLASNFCVLYRLLFQKGKLLLKKTLLKAVGNPATNQNTEDGRTDSGEKCFVCHRGVVMTANIVIEQSVCR